MKQSYTDFTDITRSEAPPPTALPFQFEGYSCMPLMPDLQDGSNGPLGFVLTRGNDIKLLRNDSESDPDHETWQRLSEAYDLRNARKDDEAGRPLPSEYWFG